MIVRFIFVKYFQYITMTAESTHRNVLIAMDGSEYSDYAFDCKFFQWIFLLLSGVGDLTSDHF